MKRKGQFFILGAIMLIILFFIGIPFLQPSLTSPIRDLPLLSKNIRLEFPVAFNLGLNESDERAVMKNFSLFLNTNLADRLIDFSTLWLYAKNSSENVNFTIGNFLGKNITVNLTISPIEKEIFVQNNGTNSTLFSSPGSIFNLTIEFESRTATVEWLRDKVNLYVFYELRRNRDVIKEEIVA